MEQLNGKVVIRQPDGRVIVQTYNSEPSMTDQSFREEVDANVILAKFMKTGDTSLLEKRRGQYMDLTQIPDLQLAMEQVREAQEAFDSLPAEVRRKLNHDPANFVNYLKDPANDAEAIRLGLKVAPPAPPAPPLPTEPVPPQT